MNWQSILILIAVVVLLGGIAVKSIYDRKKGKHSCSCGGNCGACGMGCHVPIEKNKTSK